MRILLADHHPQALRALRLMLHEVPELDLVGEAENADILLELADELAADLVLVDWDLPGEPIESLIAELRALDASLIVIVMSAKDEFGRRPLRAGADAFVSKQDEPRWLLDTLRNYAARTK